jgi:hypothetical protein
MKSWVWEGWIESINDDDTFTIRVERNDEIIFADIHKDEVREEDRDFINVKMDDMNVGEKIRSIMILMTAKRVELNSTLYWQYVEAINKLTSPPYDDIEELYEHFFGEEDD